MNIENKTSEKMFDVFPVILSKYIHRIDYRFLCLLPNSSHDVRMLTLNIEEEEAFLLYSPASKLIVGKEYKNKEKRTIEDFPLQDESSFHYYIPTVRFEGSVLPQAFDHAIETNRLYTFLHLASMLVKCGLKIEYKKAQKEYLETVIQVQDEDTGLIMRPKTSHYGFDLNRFLENKITKALEEHPKAYRLYHDLRRQIFRDVMRESEFISQFVAISQIFTEKIILQPVYPQN